MFNSPRVARFDFEKKIDVEFRGKLKNFVQRRHSLAGERSDTLERCAWSLVWLGALVGGLVLWSSWSSWPPVNYLAPLMVLVAVVGLAACWLVGATA